MKKKSILSLRHRLVCAMPLCLLVFLTKRNLLKCYVDNVFSCQRFPNEAEDFIKEYLEKKLFSNPMFCLSVAFYFDMDRDVDWWKINDRYSDFLKERAHLLK